MSQYAYVRLPHGETTHIISTEQDDAESPENPTLCGRHTKAAWHPLRPAYVEHEEDGVCFQCHSVLWQHEYRDAHAAHLIVHPSVRHEVAW